MENRKYLPGSNKCKRSEVFRQQWFKKILTFCSPIIAIKKKRKSKWLNSNVMMSQNAPTVSVVFSPSLKTVQGSQDDDFNLRILREKSQTFGFNLRIYDVIIDVRLVKSVALNKPKETEYARRKNNVLTLHFFFNVIFSLF